MGLYLNRNSVDFQMAVNSEIYVDKTLLIKELNKIICTNDKYACISRRGYADCVEGAKEMGVIYGTGVYDEVEIIDKKTMSEAFDMGRSFIVNV